MAPSLVVCPGCACHVRASESSCPLCSGDLPRGPGSSLPRTAAAIAMGLAAVAGSVSCEETTTAEYGIGPTSGGNSSVSSTGGEGGGGGEGGAGGATTTAQTSTTSATGSGGEGGDITAEYGVGPTGGGSAAR